MPNVTALSAVTIVVTDMAASTSFYEALGFEKIYGGPDAGFTSYRAGQSYLNLMLGTLQDEALRFRAIFYVDDVDEFHNQAVNAGIQPMFEPRDAPWRERYFHVKDPDGNEISFAKPLASD